MFDELNDQFDPANISRIADQEKTLVKLLTDAHIPTDEALEDDEVTRQFQAKWGTSNPREARFKIQEQMMRSWAPILLSIEKIREDDGVSTGDLGDEEFFRISSLAALFDLGHMTGALGNQEVVEPFHGLIGSVALDVARGSAVSMSNLDRIASALNLLALVTSASAAQAREELRSKLGVEEGEEAGNVQFEVMMMMESMKIAQVTGTACSRLLRLFIVIENRYNQRIAATN